jgi:ribosomal protein L14
MLLKESWVYITDNTNIRWVKLFHLYKGFHRKVTTTSFFVKGSARVVEPPRVEYKGFKYKYSVKGDICRLLLVRVAKKNMSKSLFTVQFPSNEAIIIKKKQNPASKFLNGSLSRFAIKKRKLLSLFKKTI